MNKIVTKAIYLFRRLPLPERLRPFHKEYEAFLNNKNDRRILLLYTPEHHNIGDQAIALAEKIFIQNELPEISRNCFFEITDSTYRSHKEEIAAAVKPDDLIFIHGGGIIGACWIKEEDFQADMLERFSRNKVVVLPQTIRFLDNEQGRLNRERFTKLAKNCENLTVFPRDWNSYEDLKDWQDDGVRVIPVPDIVTYLDGEHLKWERPKRKKKILFVLRGDKEKTCDLTEVCRWICEEPSWKEYEFAYASTIEPWRIGANHREECVVSKLREFAEAKLVLTDRLHGMIFAAIAGTPCIAFDNVSQKVSGQYRWLSYLPFIRQMQPKDVTKETVDELLAMDDCTYFNQELRPYYRKMKERIQELLEARMRKE